MVCSRLRLAALACCLLFGLLPSVDAGEAKTEASTPIERGLRVFSAGHSFHMFVPPLLTEAARSAGIEGHEQVGRQSIGGSYVHQHWNLPDENNSVKTALRKGEVDVLTLSPIYLPDDGIENFAKLAVEHNPDVRVTVQEFWLPFDVYDVNYKKQRPQPVDRNSRTPEQLRSISAPYFQSMDEHVEQINKRLGKQVVYVVPVGQAAIALREKIIAGEAPGLKEQNDLFRDAIGHATAPLQMLTAYCHYAVLYRRSPVGLPTPPSLSNNPELASLLQELAWKAVVDHPLSGVRVGPK